MGFFSRWRRTDDEREATAPPESAPEPDAPVSDDRARLVRALATLATQGFVTRMAFGRDLRDAIDRVEGERAPDETAPDGRREWAWVLFHEQDAEALAVAGDDAPLHLTTGAFRAAPDVDDDLVAAAAGSDAMRAALDERSRQSATHRVVEALTEQGFDPVWDGLVDSPVVIRVRGWREMPSATT